MKKPQLIHLIKGHSVILIAVGAGLIGFNSNMINQQDPMVVIIGLLFAGLGFFGFYKALKMNNEL